MKTALLLLFFIGCYARSMPTGAFDSAPYDQRHYAEVRSRIYESALRNLHDQLQSKTVDLHALKEILDTEDFGVFDNRGSEEVFEGNELATAGIHAMEVVVDNDEHLWIMQSGPFRLTRGFREWLVKGTPDEKLDAMISRDLVAESTIRRDSDGDDLYILETPLALKKFAELVKVRFSGGDCERELSQ